MKVNSVTLYCLWGYADTRMNRYCKIPCRSFTDSVAYLRQFGWKHFHPLGRHQVCQNPYRTNAFLNFHAFSGHIPVLKVICPLIPRSELDHKNLAGRTPLKEADERGTPESLTAAGYLLSIMDLDESRANGVEDEEETNVVIGVEGLALDAEAPPVDSGRPPG